MLRKEPELSEGNRAGQEAETKDLQMGKNYDRNQDGIAVIGSGKSVAKAEKRDMESGIAGIF
jgi:hypothetical protein